MILTDKSILELEVGDLVKNRASGQSYVVVNTDGHNPPVVARCTTITNPTEWLLIRHIRIG